MESSERFIRGGFWRNFLTKYEESNTLHKKMLWVADKVHRAVARENNGTGKINAKQQKMLDALWAGQCNCAYWHGVFGGLYLPHLRQALYKELLTAEQLADKALNQSGIDVKEADFDKDGMNEVVMESPEQNMYFAPHSGGSLFEWDLRPRGLNLLNVLTRRAEGYHKQLWDYAQSSPMAETSGVRTIHDGVRVKEAALEKLLHVDWYRRASLLDHFFHPNTKLDDFYRCQYGEQGDFVKTDYKVDVVRDVYPQVRLHRVGTVWTGPQQNSISVEKTISLLGNSGWQVIYRIQNVHGAACQLWYGCEMAFAFGSQDVHEPQEALQQSQWVRKDSSFGFAAKVQFDIPTDVWEFPLQTVSLSEEGFERTYQGTVLLAHTRITLNPGQTWMRSWRVGVAGA